MCDLCGDIGATGCPFCLQDVCDACYGVCCVEADYDDHGWDKENDELAEEVFG